MTYVLVSFSLKVDFISGFGRSGHPQTSRPVLLVDFSGILKLKNTVLGPKMRITLLKKVGTTHMYANENEEQP